MHRRWGWAAGGGACGRDTGPDPRAATMWEGRGTRDMLNSKTIVLSILCSVACGEPGQASTGEPGVVSGDVVDTAGRPIAGAEIVINNTVWFNHNLVLASDAAGH